MIHSAMMEPLQTTKAHTEDPGSMHLTWQNAIFSYQAKWCFEHAAVMLGPLLLRTQVAKLSKLAFGWWARICSLNRTVTKQVSFLTVAYQGCKSAHTAAPRCAFNQLWLQAETKGIYIKCSSYCKEKQKSRSRCPDRCRAFTPDSKSHTFFVYAKYYPKP